MYKTNILYSTELMNELNSEMNRKKFEYDMNVIKSTQIDGINEDKYNCAIRINDVKKSTVKKISASKMKNGMLAGKNNDVFVFFNKTEGYTNLGIQSLYENEDEDEDKEVIEHKYDKEEQINLIVQSNTDKEIFMRYDWRIFEEFRGKARKETKKAEGRQKRQYSLDVIKIMEEKVKTLHYEYKIELEHLGRKWIHPQEIMNISPTTGGFYKVGEKGTKIVTIYSSFDDVKFSKKDGKQISYSCNAEIAEQLNYIDRYKNEDLTISIGKDRDAMQEYMNNLHGFR